MAVKVINGLVGRIEPERVPSAQQPRVEPRAAAHTAFASSLNASYARSFATSDAAVSALRSTRPSNVDKIRNSDEAEKLADAVGEKVRTDDSAGGGAHSGLSPASGRANLVT